jgi:hypothetical protein
MTGPTIRWSGRRGALLVCRSGLSVFMGFLSAALSLSVRPSYTMSTSNFAKEIARIGTTAGLSKDVVDLLQTNLSLLSDKTRDLESENAVLKSNVAELEAEAAKLRAQIRDLNPVSHGLSEDHIHILKLLDKQTDCVSFERVAQRLSVNVSDVKYLSIDLVERRYIGEFVAGLQITDKGRKFVHETLA